MYYFADDASANPTFYADLRNPQSLNKYQYSYNNPLRYVDPDGHDVIDRQAAEAAEQTVKDVGKGIGKGIANIFIGMNNLMADFKVAGAEHIEPYQGSNTTQRVALVVTEDVTLFAGLLGGKAQVGGVAASEAKTTTVVAAEAGNAGRTASATTGTIERTAATAPYARPSGATTPAQCVSVQGRPCSVCGESAPKMYAGHKEALVKEHYRTGTINRTRMRSTGAVRPECPTCSNREGAQMRQYSITMRNQIPK